MDKTVNPFSSSSNFYLAGCIFLAGLDVTSLLDYGLKAAVGGSIWLGFKLVENRLLKKKSATQQSGEPGSQQPKA